ncbi:MAG: NAD-dependent epimerase/dehydratase family protein [Bacteroidales bacterium]
MKILITGGAGFIGSNLCEYFLQQGHQVRCLDNLATGYMENMSDFMEHPSFFELQPIFLFFTTSGIFPRCKPFKS